VSAPRFRIERRLTATDFSIYRLVGPRKLPVLGTSGESLRFETRSAAEDYLTVASEAALVAASPEAA
jgi:hypothetical protein